jgi:hypothetical protein
MENQKVKKLLSKMAKVDQDVIRKIQKEEKLQKNGILIDKKGLIEKTRRINTKKLKNLIKTYGFPSISLVGLKGTRDAWLIAQHSDYDLKFQKRYLAMMKKLTKKKEVLLQNLAYLTDRVRESSGLPQIYGTQIGPYSLNKNLRFKPGYVTDPRKLDKRRKAMGLEPFAKYVKRCGMHP